MLLWVAVLCAVCVGGEEEMDINVEELVAEVKQAAAKSVEVQELSEDEVAKLVNLMKKHSEVEGAPREGTAQKQQQQDEARQGQSQQSKQEDEAQEGEAQQGETREGKAHSDGNMRPGGHDGLPAAPPADGIPLAAEQPVMQHHLRLFMGTGSSLDTITYGIPNTIKVICTTFPDINGHYKLHTVGTWNSRCVWYKGTTHMIYYSNEGRWAIARRQPMAIITTALGDAVNINVPPRTNWRVPVALTFGGLGVLPSDISLLFHPVGKWQAGKRVIEIEDAAMDDNLPEGTGYSYRDPKGDAYELVPADLRPPAEMSGHITATWVVQHPAGDIYITMVSQDELHIMDAGGVVSATDMRSTESAAEADDIARDILKMLFNSHFSKPSIAKVTGCTELPMKGKTQTTSKCSATEPTTLTISGQNFGKSGAVVWLLKRVDDAKTEIPCANAKHDPETPSQKLTCTMPPLGTGVVLDVVVVASGSNNEKFESMLYGAVRTETTQKSTIKGLMFQDFEELGVGGLGPEFEEMFRRAFASRLQNDEVIRRLGIRHVRGVVLYGPPGTGKTLLARRIGEMLGASKVHTVSGPEVMSKYVGQSESNLRKLFEQARADAENDDGLHLIIFDEMDAIMLPRGQGDDSGARAVYDGVTTQLLTLMDGIDDRGNLLVLGLTNRLEAVDKALLRPGRFEVKIKMPLPDEKGRHEIFTILTKSSRESGMVADDVDLKQLAKDTPSFTGADIEGVIKSATSYALMGASENQDKILVTMDHFKKALKEVQPSQGSVTALTQYLEGGVIHYDEEFTEMLLSFDRPVHRVKHGKRNKMLKILIEGEPGSGLTTVASYIAKRSGFPFVHLLSMEDAVGSSESEELVRIRKVFENAYLVERSCIILDKLELLLEKSHGRNLQHTLQQLLTKKPEGKGKLLVLVTTNSIDTLRYMGLNTWDMTSTVPYLDKAGMETVFQEVKAFEDLETTQSITSKMPLRIGIKKLLWLVDQARVMHGIDEDVHEAGVVHGKHPFTKGKTQYVVPAAYDAKEGGALFVDMTADDGWHGTQATRDADPDLPEIERLTKAGYIHPKIFLQLLQETGLLTYAEHQHGDTHRSDEGLPTATGTLML